MKKKLILPGGESNPGLPRDRRGYLPLYYRGLLVSVVTQEPTSLISVCKLTARLNIFVAVGREPCASRSENRAKEERNNDSFKIFSTVGQQSVAQKMRTKGGEKKKSPSSRI